MGTSDSIELTITAWKGTQGEGCSSGTPVLLFQLPTIEVFPFLPFFHLLTPRLISLDACMLSKVTAPDVPCVGASAHQGGLNLGSLRADTAPHHHPTRQIRTETSSLSTQSRLPSLLCVPTCCQGCQSRRAARTAEEMRFALDTAGCQRLLQERLSSSCTSQAGASNANI